MSADDKELAESLIRNPDHIVCKPYGSPPYPTLNIPFNAPTTWSLHPTRKFSMSVKSQVLCPNCQAPLSFMQTEPNPGPVYLYTSVPESWRSNYAGYWQPLPQAEIKGISSVEWEHVLIFFEEQDRLRIDFEKRLQERVDKLKKENDFLYETLTKLTERVTKLDEDSTKVVMGLEKRLKAIEDLPVSYCGPGDATLGGIAQNQNKKEDAHVNCDNDTDITIPRQRIHNAEHLLHQIMELLPETCPAAIERARQKAHQALEQIRITD